MSAIANKELLVVSQDPNLTDEQRLEHIKTYKDTVNQLVETVISGAMHLVLMGAPGQGKTQTVTDLLQASDKSWAGIKGTASAIGVYKFLYENRDADVVVIDDCDSLFQNAEAANILKAAMDSKSERVISWAKQNSNLASIGLPNSFVSTAQIIIITNEDLVNNGGRVSKSQRLMEPVIDRAIPFKTGMPNRQWEADYFKLMHETDSLLVFKEEGLSADEQAEIMQFVIDNAEKWNEMTFRLLGHIARFYKSNKATYQSMSLLTL